MRPTLLGFDRLLPIVLLLALPATEAHAAGVQRAPKRAKPAASAPAPVAEALPALPAPPADPTATVALTSASLAAPAAGPAGQESGGSAAPSASAPATPSVYVPPPLTPTKTTGFVFQLGSGALVPAGALVHGMGTISPGMAFDIRLGSYVSQHVGLLIGFRGSYGHTYSGCDHDCAGYSLQVPLLMQLAAKDRTKGFYAEFGAGLGTTYGGSGGGVTYKLSSPVEAKLGMGFRAPTSRTASFDFNMGADVGTIKSGKVSAGSASYEGSIDGDTHVVIAINAIAHFSL